LNSPPLSGRFDGFWLALTRFQFRLFDFFVARQLQFGPRHVILDLDDVLGQFPAQVAAAKDLGCFQALIRFVADIAGQAGDFAIAGIHGFEGCGGFQYFNFSTWHHLANH
jgi:hypothetical protein